MDTIPVNKCYLTAAESAALLGISSCTLYRMIKTGILPAQKIGHTWKISATDISACINQK